MSLFWETDGIKKLLPLFIHGDSAKNPLGQLQAKFEALGIHDLNELNTALKKRDPKLDVHVFADVVNRFKEGMGFSGVTSGPGTLGKEEQQFLLKFLDGTAEEALKKQGKTMEDVPKLDGKEGYSVKDLEKLKEIVDSSRAR